MTVGSKARLLLTVGDPNGIGPEIAMKAAMALRDEPELRPVIIADHYILEDWARRLGTALNVDRADWGRDGVDAHPTSALPMASANPGDFSAETGAATIAYLEMAVRLVQDGTGRGIVGCPHSESAINATGRQFSGYPGLIAELTGQKKDKVFLTLIGGGLRIVHATLHEGVRSALDRLTPDLVCDAAIAGASALVATGITNPKIGLFGINPHAGEQGLFGTEDGSVTVVAAERLRAAGYKVYGPEGADVMLQRAEADLYVAMYHDQGHIPVKLLAGHSASALSVGGDIVFSSVGHGAAFDIAGDGVADPTAVIRTLRLLGGMA